jgi:hypothetical protein
LRHCGNNATPRPVAGLNSARSNIVRIPIRIAIGYKKAIGEKHPAEVRYRCCIHIIVHCSGLAHVELLQLTHRGKTSSSA